MKRDDKLPDRVWIVVSGDWRTYQTGKFYWSEAAALRAAASGNLTATGLRADSKHRYGAVMYSLISEKNGCAHD